MLLLGVLTFKTLVCFHSDIFLGGGEGEEGFHGIRFSRFFHFFHLGMLIWYPTCWNDVSDATPKFSKSVGSQFQCLYSITQGAQLWALSITNKGDCIRTLIKTWCCATVAVYLRSLRIRAAEEKNIPRRSRKLMNCK